MSKPGRRSGARRDAPPPRKPVAAATGVTIALAVGLVAALVAVALWASSAPTVDPIPPGAPPATTTIAPRPPVATTPAPRASETPRPPAPTEEPDEPEPEPEPEAPVAPAPDFATAWAKGPTEVVRVERVVDGDTLALTDGRRVRLVGINTPEKDTPLYKDASALLRELVDGQEITLEFDEERIDQYKRTLAYVFKGEMFVNGEIVRRGMAYCYTWEPNTAHRDELISFQRDARDAGRGLWGLPAPRPESVYVADGRGHRFHRPSCRRVERIRERLEFKSRAAAFDAGQNPCGDCNP